MWKKANYETEKFYFQLTGNSRSQLASAFFLPIVVYIYISSLFFWEMPEVVASSVYENGRYSSVATRKDSQDSVRVKYHGKRVGSRRGKRKSDPRAADIASRLLKKCVLIPEKIEFSFFSLLVCHNLSFSLRYFPIQSRC